ncbi:MAG: hypothetical protein HAW66_02765 [Shewanella sp.]|nr:hypothetical protein [Shewanella sp.]
MPPDLTVLSQAYIDAYHDIFTPCNLTPTEEETQYLLWIQNVNASFYVTRINERDALVEQVHTNKQWYFVVARTIMHLFIPSLEAKVAETISSLGFDNFLKNYSMKTDLNKQSQAATVIQQAFRTFTVNLKRKKTTGLGNIRIDTNNYCYLFDASSHKVSQIKRRCL